ncbi:MAG: thiol peroxidase [Candidatus Brocadiia bacterium]|nr:MAG: thiol peroxidase [Candidatus Brocadiia bacterium]
MEERKGIITVQGNPLTLLGETPSVGIAAPDFEVLAADLSPVKLSDFKGKVRIICSVPSLDTPVCDIETKKFNEKAASLGNDVVIMALSMDLPFAQARWCGAAGVENVKAYSDHRQADFGQKYGVLIKELRLLARAVFVVDKKGAIRYIEIVPELTKEPNYESAIDAAKKLL